MIVLTGFVFISTAIGFVTMALADNQVRTPLEDVVYELSLVLDNIFVAIFLVDVMLRIYTMGFKDYCYDTLCFLDLLVSSIDIATISVTLFTTPDNAAVPDNNAEVDVS